MGIAVDPADLDPKNLPAEVPGAPLYRFGGPFYTGAQKAVILACSKHSSKSEKAAAEEEGREPRTTSIAVTYGLVGQPTTDGTPPLVKFTEYVGLGKDRFSSAKRINLMSTLEPELAKTRGSFECGRQVGKWNEIMVEAEEARDGYAERPRLTRIIAVVAAPNPTPAQVHGPKADAPKTAGAPAQPAEIPDSSLPF